MVLSTCHRYWWAVEHEGPRKWVLYFKPCITSGRLETRWGFASPQHAARAKALLVMEHFTSEECVGK